MFCPNCGYENPEGSEACGRCGTKLLLQRNPIVDDNKALAQKQKVSFSVSFYEFYVSLCVFIGIAIGGTSGYFIGMFGDFMKGRKDNLYTTIFTIIGIVLGWAIGKINTMIPKLLLIIAKDTEQLCGKTDVDDGNNDKRLSKDGIKM